MLYQMKFIKPLYRGRSPMVTDVIIDGMGVLLGILLVLLVIKLYNKLKKALDSRKLSINIKN